MNPNIKIPLSFFHIEYIFIFFSIFILQVNAETKIIAKDGDTLLKLSKQYRVSLRELMHKNNFNDANRIIEGEVILIPLDNNNNNKAITYRVKKGDTLYKIAKDHNLNIKDIISINNLENASLLKPNQLIILPNAANNKKLINKKNIKIASKKAFYHQTIKTEDLSEIALIHNVLKEDIILFNNLNNQSKINSNTKLRLRKNKSLKWLKYGSLIINWSDWRYLDGHYITHAKNKKNKSFYLAINCERRSLNNTLKNSNWSSWYFPDSDFEFKLINDFCEQDF